MIIETKTSSEDNKTIKSLITQRQYDLTTNSDTLKAFRRLGGSETAQRSYTSNGYVVTKLISRNPSRQIKIVREYSFISLGYKEQLTFDKLFKNYEDGLFYLKRFKRGLTLSEVKQVLKDKLK